MAVESSVPAAGFGDKFKNFFSSSFRDLATFPPFRNDELVLSYCAFLGWNAVPPSEPKVRPGLGPYR